MDRLLPATVVLGALVLLVALMYRGWRARQRRQDALPRVDRVPDDAGDVLFAAEAFYVATTSAGDPLDRIAIAGLGYRARAQLGVTSSGVILSIPGQDDIFIPASGIRAIDRATHVIDRVVERDGLIVIDWMLGGTTAVESYFRIADPELAKDALAQLAPLVRAGKRSVDNDGSAVRSEAARRQSTQRDSTQRDSTQRDSTQTGDSE